MGTLYYTLERIPDFTMAKYSTQENGTVDAVLRQHSAFYRQLHRRGQLFGEHYTLLYWYEPSRSAGQKIRMLFRVEGQQESVLMDEFLNSASLAASFPLRRCQMKEPGKVRFDHRAVLVKRSGRIPSSVMASDNSFYVVDAWKNNENGRLMSLFRLMKAMDRSCVYAVHLYPTEQTERYRSALQAQMKWMKPEGGLGLGIAQQRDENAEKCSKRYQDLVDELRGNPHFYCEISAYADDPATAKLLVDAAASEAVEEGNYTVLCSQTPGQHTPLAPERWYVPPERNTPTGVEFWHALFLLKELVPFAVFPTLYAGESIELPKETAPIYEKQGLDLGEDQQGYEVYFPLELLKKHALITGMPGSGKTYTMLHLAAQLASEDNRVPVLILEPAKQEYRVLVRNPKVRDLTVFSPGGGGSFPLRINPFEFPRGMKLSEHIVNLRQVFIGAFDLEAPMPFLLDQGIENVYRACGWYPFDYNDFDENGRNAKPYPDMQMLFDEVEQLLDRSNYAEDVRSNLKTVLQVRIGSLISRETGNVFNVPRSTFRPEEWMQHSCVLELESLGKDVANFLTLLLSTIIRSYIKQNPKSERTPRHVIFFEEAHNLIGPSAEANQNTGNAKVASTKFIVDMLAEVRALHEAIVIADQLPTALASQVTKNTALKIAMRMTAQDDREMLAAAMSADGVQMEQMALFGKGKALCIYENVQKPFELKITCYDGKTEPLDDQALYQLQIKRETYCACMKRDLLIMAERLENRRNRLIERWSEAVRADEELKAIQKQVFSLQDPELKREKLGEIRTAKAAQFRKKKELMQSHLELILEFGEYVRTNRYMSREGREKLAEEQKMLMETLEVCDMDPDYPMKDLTDHALREMQRMWNQMVARRW